MEWGLLRRSLSPACSGVQLPAILKAQHCAVAYSRGLVIRVQGSGIPLSLLLLRKRTEHDPLSPDERSWSSWLRRCSLLIATCRRLRFLFFIFTAVFLEEDESHTAKSAGAIRWLKRFYFLYCYTQRQSQIGFYDKLWDDQMDDFRFCSCSASL